ncbi:MAG TPA: SDR family oxidoreductase [Actinomycetes bacterium]|nr:SDR family oxidoreductase [Actinomycetes bacterium]
MRLENKVALITGGGSGIGAATARLFAREGAKLVVTGRRPGPLAGVAEEVGGVAVAGDTSDPAHVTDAVAAAVSNFGGLDVVVTCAGGGFGGSVGELDDGHWRSTFDTNLNGPMMMTRAAMPVMLKRGGGAVVLVASVNGIAAAPSSAAYDVSKAGVIALARALAVDYGTRGIRTNALCPGWVSTSMGDDAMDELGKERGISRQDAYDLATAEVPLRRAGTAEEMAACCLFLASAESSFVNGTTLVADGGGLAVEITSTAFGPG